MLSYSIRRIFTRKLYLKNKIIKISGLILLFQKDFSAEKEYFMFNIFVYSNFCSNVSIIFRIFEFEISILQIILYSV